MFGSDLEHRVWSRFWNWNLANILRLVLTWDLTIFGNTIGNKDRGEVIPRTWFHSFFSRKKSEIWIAFTFFEKWKVKNKIPSLFFEKWKWNWNGSRSRTRSENEKKFLRILEKRESRWSLWWWYPGGVHGSGGRDGSGGGDEMIRYMTQLLLLGKFEYTGGPIFKVVLEC